MRTKEELHVLAVEWLQSRGMNDARRARSLTDLLERVQREANSPRTSSPREDETLTTRAQRMRGKSGGKTYG